MKKKGKTFVEDTPGQAPADPETVGDAAPVDETAPAPIETVRWPFDTVLKCKLTDAETLAYAREAADVNAAIAQLDADMKSLVKEYKGKIALKQARHETLSSYIATGFEHRTVKCERIYDYEARLVREERLDGQEPRLISERGLTTDELQRQLALVER